ncbi:hypothetical protein [Salinarimonas sp.]|uniref:hypothetical protein n=1 Tax=Salinarimonas sp. TaxID=2766526 RepID=UPI0032D9354B
MIPPSYIYPWFDRTEAVGETLSSTHARRPWLARGREMHFLAALVAAAAVLGA